MLPMLDQYSTCRRSYTPVHGRFAERFANWTRGRRHVLQIFGPSRSIKERPINRTRNLSEDSSTSYFTCRVSHIKFPILSVSVTKQIHIHNRSTSTAQNDCHTQRFVSSSNMSVRRPSWSWSSTTQTSIYVLGRYSALNLHTGEHLS